MEQKLKPNEELALILEELDSRHKYNKIAYVFQATGKYRRELYPKQLEFFNATAKYNQVAMVAANRSGKSFAAACMMVWHLTGLYPEWWTGRKFKNPINAWSIGVSNTQTKQVNQAMLCGDFTDLGSGLIPKSCIGKKVSKAGVGEGIESIKVKHFTNGVFDGWSDLCFKSYEMERISFQGHGIHFAWLDEEPPPGKADIYTEVLSRTATTNGLIVCTFTPLFGISDIVMSFCPGGRFPADGIVRTKDGRPLKYVVNLQWDASIPHLPADKQQELLDSYAPHERDARSKGIPQLGSGAIYPIPEEEISCDPFSIPPNWKRVLGVDVSPRRAAIIWGAISPGDGTVYLYSEYYAEKLPHPAMIKDAMESRGRWIPGCIDPAADKLIAPGDGRSFMRYFEDNGIELVAPKREKVGLEAGIWKQRSMLESGMLKVFKNLQHWFSEYRLYRRDDKGQVIAKDNDLLDATRYLLMIGLDLAETEEEALGLDGEEHLSSYSSRSGASEITGY